MLNLLKNGANRGRFILVAADADAAPPLRADIARLGNPSLWMSAGPFPQHPACRFYSRLLSAPGTTLKKKTLRVAKNAFSPVFRDRRKRWRIIPPAPPTAFLRRFLINPFERGAAQRRGDRPPQKPLVQLLFPPLSLFRKR